MNAYYINSITTKFLIPLKEYVDYAEYYDQLHDITYDISFYLEYAKQTGEPVLELACGTGRVVIPIAEAGIRIHGLDLSENMRAGGLNNSTTLLG